MPFPTHIPFSKFALLLNLADNSLFYLDPRGCPGKLAQRHTWLFCINNMPQTHSVLGGVSRETSFHGELCGLGGTGREEDPEIAGFDCMTALLSTQKLNRFS